MYFGFLFIRGQRCTKDSNKDDSRYFYFDGRRQGWIAFI